MGLLDIPAPLFAAADGLLGFLPVLLRLLFWAVATSCLSMGLYWLVSAQDKIEVAKKRAIAARKKMSSYDGVEFDEMLPLAMDSLAASGKHVLIVMLPAMLSSLPALSLIVWVSGQFSYQLPEVGEQIAITSTPALAVTNLATDPNDPETQTATWPSADNPVALIDQAGIELTSLPLPASVPIVHQRAWWNSLIGNPNGYLPEQSDIQAVEFAIPRQKYLSIGPVWAHGWEIPYFLVLLLCSLGIKFVFKIH